MSVRRQRPPDTLDSLRALLDDAAVRRTLIPHEGPVQGPEEMAMALNAPLTGIGVAVIAEADGDMLAAIIPGDGRLDLGLVAVALGAVRARVAGAEVIRRRFGYAVGQVPLLTGLPTLIDASLLGREHLFGATGDPLWTLKIAPRDLRRATNALIAPITRRRTTPQSHRVTDEP